MKKASFDLPRALLGAAAVAAFRDEALALADDQVEALSVEPSVMMTNVRAGVESVHARLAEALEARPRTRVEWILALPNLGRAVEHAAATAPAAPAVTRAQIDAKYAELQRYRVPAMLQVKVFACDLFADLDADQVARVEAGAGIYNHAQDGVVLASLFRATPSVAGRHPFTEAQLAAMEAAGAWLMENVTPGGARHRKRPAGGAAAALRDRLWTLLRVRHAELRKVGIELFGEDAVDEFVPRLGHRAAAKAAPPVDNDNDDPDGGEPSDG